MRKVIKINFLIIAAIVFCNIAQAQQKASDKSFTTVLSEVKQKQAMRNKMLQQMRQTLPTNTSQNNNTDIKPSNTNPGTATQQNTIPGSGTKQQATNNQPLNQPVKIPARSKDGKQVKL
jgi:hypothetical protein